MRRVGQNICLLVFSCGLLAAETRFGLPVANLETPKAFRSLELTGNKFAVSQKSDLVVAANVYGGPWRYYVDVALNNRSNHTIQLADDFVRFQKNGTAVAPTNTSTIVGELAASLAHSKTVAARTDGPTPFGSAALLQRAQADQERKRAEEFVAHVKAFAHEAQPLTLAPGKMTMYTFVFSAPDRERMDFSICVWAGDEEFEFAYKK